MSHFETLRRAHGNPILHLNAQVERESAERRRTELEKASQGSLGELLFAYVAKLKREGKRSAREVENAFRLHVHKRAPDLVDRKAKEITPSDIHSILSNIAAAGKTWQVNKIRSFLMAAFNYGATLRMIPAEGKTRQHSEWNSILRH